MPTKKKVAQKASTSPTENSTGGAHAAFEKAVGGFRAALETLHQGDLAGAQKQFEAVAESNRDEPVLSERARMYAAVCARRLTPAADEPRSSDDRYYRAVMLCNDGDADAAIRLLDEALQSEPSSSRILYARASAWALKGRADAAIGDLRQAITGDPRLRFQAVNDPDFDPIREEPAFIDIIEPTPTGT